MTEVRNRNIDSSLFSLLAGVALVLAVAYPALAGGKPGGGGGGSSPCDGLTNDSDQDFDGLGDLEDCQGLVETRNEVAFDFPGCLPTPEAAPNCTRHDVPDIFVEIHRDTASTGTSGFDENFGGLGSISDDELFSFAEAPISAGGLGINIHVVPPGSFLSPSVRPRGVVQRSNGTGQSGITLIEDRSLAFPRDASGKLTCLDPPPPTGFTFQGNPNEFGNPQVFTQRIFDRIDCVFGNLSTPGNFADKRLHVINTVNHELGHTIEIAPDPTSHHTATGSNCVMDATLEPNRRGDFPIPTEFCGNSQSAIAAGTTSVGQPTFCGDNTTFDGDPMENCITTPSAPAP